MTALWSILGPNFPAALEGWFVPRYLVEGPDAPAPDLRTPADLARYAELFADPEDPDKGRFYNCVAGWVCEEINTKKLEVYGLTDLYTNFRPGSGGAMAADMCQPRAPRAPGRVLLLGANGPVRSDWRSADPAGRRAVRSGNLGRMRESDNPTAPRPTRPRRCMWAPMPSSLKPRRNLPSCWSVTKRRRSPPRRRWPTCRTMMLTPMRRRRTILKRRAIGKAGCRPMLPSACAQRSKCATRTCGGGEPAPPVFTLVSRPKAGQSSNV
jgi:hypothetical protein